MAEDSIDRLAIEVSGDAEQAVRTLGRLVNRLSTLETRLSMAASKTLTFSAAISNLSRSLSGLDVSPLKGFNDIKFSATVPKNIASLVNTLRQMPEDAVTKLQGVVTALGSQRGISLTKGTVDSLARIPAVLREFESLDMNAFVEQIAQINPKIAELAQNVTKLAAAYKSLPKSMQTAGLAARSVAASNKYLSQTNKELDSSSKKAKVSVSELGAALKKAFSFAGLLTGWYSFKRMFEGTVGSVNTYIEDMNLFNASMGEFAESASTYAQKVSDILGIDMGEWAKYTGVFQNLGTSFGIAGERAATMSQNLTQLGYDLASFHNMKVDETMLKIQSGLAGEIEPMRRIGVDLSNAAMQIEATDLGLSKKVAAMNQAEKAALRYRLMLKGTAIAQGDMARTIASPANQLRVLKAQFQLAARAIGNLFIPALNAILPVVIGVVKALTLLARTIAEFFGIDVTFEVDYGDLASRLNTGGLEDLTDALDDSGSAADSAKKKVKEYQNTVMGFDQLNKLNAPPDDTGKDITNNFEGAGSVLGDIPLDTYDFLAGLSNRMSAVTDEIAAKIRGLLPHIVAVAAGLLAWRVAKALGADLKETVGLVLAVVGAVKLVTGAFDAWVNGVNWDNLRQMLVGTALLATGLGIAFGSVGAVIGLVTGGIAMLVVGIKDMWENGFSPESFAAVEAGFGVIGGAIGFLIAGPIGALVGALIGIGAGIITTLILDWEGFTEWFGGLMNSIVEGTRFIWEPVATWFNDHVVMPVSQFFGGLGPFFSGLWQGIVNGISNWWGGVARWMNDHVIQPIVNFWTPIVNWWSRLLGSLKATNDAIWHNIGEFVKGIWMIIQRAWGIACEWFDQHVLQPVANIFVQKWNAIKTSVGNVWQGIRQVWSVVAGWFDQHVLGPLRQKFGTAWNNITSAASRAWQGIQNTFSGVANFFGTIFGQAWARVKGAFSSGGQIFQGVVNAIVNSFKSLANNVIGGLNWAIAQPFDGLNSIIRALKGWQIFDFYPFAGFWEVPVPRIPYLAEGRYGIDSGQLFVAREAGPELVGTMGNKTTVANNRQIVEGIEAGVMSGVLRALAVGRSEGGETSIEIPLRIGTEEIARAVWRGEASLVRRGVLQPQFV